MAKADILRGALIVGEVVAAAAIFAVLNASKGNTDRGTFAFLVKKDAQGQSTGKGGVDLDVSLGAALILGAAVAPPAFQSHLAAFGAGGLACYGARAGLDYGAKHQDKSVTVYNPPQFPPVVVPATFAPQSQDRVTIY